MRSTNWIPLTLCGSASRPVEARPQAPQLIRPRPVVTGYRWVRIPAGQHRSLIPVCEAFGTPEVELWVGEGGGVDRTSAEGLITGRLRWRGGWVGVVWSDFRVNAASFGRANSRRLRTFLQELDALGDASTPVLYFVNSAGLSLMEGRAVFADAFALWPALLAYAERHLLLTCALGRCLGLAPLLYGLGHYRLAVADRTHLNLTGPEVIARFFGTRVDFDRDAAAERFVETTTLVHDLVPSVAEACRRFRSILEPEAGAKPASIDACGPRTSALLGIIYDAPPLEVIRGWCGRLRVFIGTRHGTPLGVFVNPVERSDNMITVRTLDKYAAGLDLCRALRVPIVSLLDSPGIDPRFDQSAANNIQRILAVGERIIRYPWGSMGVVVGRAFGGASTLGFPKVFGGTRMVALRGCNIGTMHPDIVTELLKGAPRLLEQWEQVVRRQGPGCEDLLANGTIDAVVDLADLPSEIDRFLGACTPDRPRLHARRAGVGL